MITKETHPLMTNILKEFSNTDIGDFFVLESLKYTLKLNQSFIDEVENYDELEEYQKQDYQDQLKLIEHLNEVIRYYGG